MADGNVAVSKALEITAKANPGNAARALSSLTKSLDDLKQKLKSLSKLNTNTKELDNISRSLERLSKVGKIKIGLSISKGTIDNLNDIVKAAKSIDNETINKLTALGDALKNMQGVKITSSALKNIANGSSTASSSGIKDSNSVSGQLNSAQKEMAIALYKAASAQNKYTALLESNSRVLSNSLTTTGRTSGGTYSNAGGAYSGFYGNGRTYTGATGMSYSGSGGALVAAPTLGMSTPGKDNRGTWKDLLTDIAGSAEFKAAVAGVTWATKTFKKRMSVVTSALKVAMGLAKKFGSILKSALSVGASAAANLGKKFIGQFTEPVAKAINTVKSAFAGLFRIAYYRAFRTLIKEITSGFSTGLENMYYWASTSDKVLKASMDSLATSAQYLKNSLAAMVAPLINAVAPVIEQITTQLASLFNMVGKFLAYLTGQSTYTAALRVPTTYADALDDAADSANNAKKASQWLLGIDELNILPDDTDTSTGSASSGKTYADYANMFETLDVSDIPDWLKTIKEMWASGEYAELGTYIGELLNDIVDGFDAKSWGRSLGQKIQSGITVALNFLRTFSMKKLGAKFGDFISGLMETVSPSDLGALISKEFTDALEFVSGTLSGLGSWGSYIAGIVNGWFSEVDGKEIGENLHYIITNVITNLSTFLSGLNWETIKGDISGFWEGFNFEGIWNSFKTLLGTAEDTVFTLTGTSSWGELAGKIALWIGDSIYYLSTWWNEHKSDFEGVWTTIKEGIASGLNFQDQDGDGSAFDDFEEWLYNGLLDKALNVIDDISDWIVDNQVAYKITYALGRMVRQIDWGEIIAQALAGLYASWFDSKDEKVNGFVSNVVGWLFGSNGSTPSESNYNHKTSGLSYSGVYGTGSGAGRSTSGTSNNPLKVYVTPTTTSSTPTVGEVLGTTRTTKNPLKANTVLSEGTGYVALPTFTGTEQTKVNPLKAATILTKGTGVTSVTNLFGLNQTYYVGVTPVLTQSLASLISGQTVTVGTTTQRVYGNGTKTTTTGSASIMFKANGGFVDEGQLFVANEKGAEMVGSMDGKTAVANNGQIVEGIQQGVYNAMMRAMSSSGGSNGNVSVTLNLDGKTVYDSVLKQNKDTYNRTGRNPLTAY